MIIKHNSDLFESFEDKLVIGWLPMQVESATPIMRWKGPKINIKEVWWPMLAFYKEHIEHEVQTRFVMDEKQTRVEVVCFNQKYGTGMSTKELDDPELQNQLTAGGWINVGTAHSHCKMAAFASHTDRENEAKANPLDKTNNIQVGLHVTVGKLDEEQYDLHLRMVWMVPGRDKANPARYATLDPVLEDWFELPEYFGPQVREDEKLVGLLLKYLLTQPPPPSVRYPQEWKLKLKEEPRSVYHAPNYIPAGGYHPHQHQQIQHFRPARPLWAENDYNVSNHLYDDNGVPVKGKVEREPQMDSSIVDPATVQALEACKDALQKFVNKQENWMGLDTWWDLEPSEASEFRALNSPLYRKAINEADVIASGFGFQGLEEFFFCYTT
jgi:hypothetical protein